MAKRKSETTSVAPKKAKIAKVSTKEANYTLCIPTTIINQCRGLEQITQVLYQIARTATIYNVGEIVILDEPTKKQTIKIATQKKLVFGNEAPETAETEKKSSDAVLIASILQYFVTPPYLVKNVFKSNYLSNFKYAAKLPKLSSLPYMKNLQDEGRYREGLTVNMKKPSKNTKKFQQTKFVNVGKTTALELKGQLVPTNVRVTVDTIDCKVVSPVEAYGDAVGAQSSYGYMTRIVKKFNQLFTESAFPEGYSQSLYVDAGDFYSEKKEQVAQMAVVKHAVKLQDKIPNVLLVVGKWSDVQYCFDDDKESFEGVEGAHQFFDGRVEVPAGLRIEDASMIALTKLNVE